MNPAPPINKMFAIIKMTFLRCYRIHADVFQIRVVVFQQKDVKSLGTIFLIMETVKS